MASSRRFFTPSVPHNLFCLSIGPLPQLRRCGRTRGVARVARNVLEVELRAVVFASTDRK